MMSLCIQNSILSTLPGYKGSNPHIVDIYPPIVEDNEILLNKILPFGTKPGDIHTFKHKENTFLSVVFEIPQENDRNDLVALSFALDKHAIVKNFEVVMKELIKRLQEHNLMKMELLKENLTSITEAINKESKIKIGSMIFDVNYYLESKKIKLSEIRRIKGGLI